jgi:predicted DNA-binding protein
MSTTKQRLQISLAVDIAPALKALAKRDGVPRATKAAQLLRFAIETEEDFALYTIASEREKTAQRLLTHAQVWG